MQDCNYFDEDTFTMKNPNLYITFPSSDYSAYLLLESGGIILLESGLENFLLT